MKSILEAPFIVDMTRALDNMYNHGWDERNGGNVSVMLDEAELAEYLDTSLVLRRIPMTFAEPALDGKIFIVTGTGKYFKNAKYDPAANLGIVRLAEGGAVAELLWGFTDGGKFTSEFPAHIMSHAVALGKHPEHRVVMHCHPTNIIAMTFVHSLDSREFTVDIWRTCTECLVVFPDGINVLPWMLCGTNEIGVATAEQMKTARMVVWAQHGIYGTGRDLDEVFGLIETAEKGAEIYMKTFGHPILQTITNENLKEIEAGFGVKAREGWLD